jgi:hypothetical protein
MPLDRQSAIRLAAAMAGLENHDARIRADTPFAYQVTKSQFLLRELHATYGIANRLEMLVKDCSPPVRFDVMDLADGSLRPPFLMLHQHGLSLVKFMRLCLGRSPIVKIEITAQRDVILHGLVYDDHARRSILKPVDRSSFIHFQEAG